VHFSFLNRFTEQDDRFYNWVLQLHSFLTERPFNLLGLIKRTIPGFR